jgi:hypothetical protein
VRVLHRDLSSELDVFADRFPEFLVSRHACGVKGSHVQLDESLPLLFADLEVPVDSDQMFEATQLARESIRSAERLGCERSEMVDVVRLSFSEQRLEERVGKHRAIEDFLEVVERGLATGELEQRRHAQPSRRSPLTS